MPAIDALTDLFIAVRASSKYAHVSEEIIRRIGAQELAKRRNLKESIKETKNKLHQVGALYLGEKLPYGRWLATLDDEESLNSALRAHTSTRERAPIAAQFYARVFEDLGPVTSVLDVACGMNPLLARHMPLAPGAVYHAGDIYADLIDFLNAAGPRIGLDLRAQVRDALSPAARDWLAQPVDVALVLKTIPCLEQVDKDAGARLLDTIQARTLIVSYPTRSVGGKNVGMAAHYRARFEALIAGRGWDACAHTFENELAFVLRR